MAQIRLRPRAEVVINGITRRLLSADTTTGAEIITAQGSVVVDPRQGKVSPGSRVEIRASFGSPDTILTGTVKSNSVKHAPKAISFEVVGNLSRAAKPIGIPPLPDEDSEVDEDGNPIPLMSWSGVTTRQIVIEALNLCGCTFSEDDIGGDDTVVGTVNPIVLGRGQSPLEFIGGLDYDYGSRTYENPDGSIRRIEWSGLPSGTPALALVEGQTMQNAEVTQDIDGMFNRINVSGVTSDDFPTPRATVQADSKINPETGEPYIPTPPQYQADEHDSPYLETNDACVAFGERFLGEHNRIQERATADCMRGSPGIRGGQSCYLISTRLGIGAERVWRVGNVHHTIDARGFNTDLTLLGGYAGEGTDPNVKPVPSFTILVLREHIAGAAGDIWVVVADASGSTDPDGAYDLPDFTNELGQLVLGTKFNGIFLYQWESTITGTPALLAKGAKAIWFTDENPTGKTITLTVFDNQLKDATITKTIADTPGSPYMLRDLWAAVNSELLFTNDGERTWQHIAVPAIFVCEQAADTFNLALDATGKLYRVTTAAVVTTPASAPANGTAASIRWVSPDTATPGDRCWEGTANGQIWFSADKGLTWALRGTIPGGPSVVWIGESPFAEGDIYASAGRQILHSFDAGATWEVLYVHPNTLLTATKMAAGFGHGFVAFHGAPPAVSPDLEESRIKERRSQVEGNWNKSSTTVSLPVGTYKAAIAYTAAGGETTISPTTDVVIAAGQVVRFAPRSPLPAAATGIRYYLSQAAGSATLRRCGEGSGIDELLISHAPAAGIGPSVTNTTLGGLAAPTAPTATAIASPSGEPDDFPAQPSAVTMGVGAELLFAVGQEPLGAGASWYAQADAPFTFMRGEYPTDQLGLPADIIRDGLVEFVVYGAAATGLFKTVDGFQATCFRILELTGAQIGRKIGYGLLHPTPPLAGAVSYICLEEGGDGTFFFIQLTSEGWRLGGEIPFPVPDAGNNFSTYGMVRAADAVTFYAWRRSVGVLGGDNDIPNMFRSVDGGDTWTLLDRLRVVDVKVSGDGTVFLSRYDFVTNLSYIETSIDRGDNWVTVSARGPFFTGGGANFGDNISVQREDSSIVWVRDGGGLRYSSDGGATFTAGVAVVINEGNSNAYPMVDDTEGRVLTGKSPVVPNVVVANPDLSLVSSTEDAADNDNAFYRYGAADGLYHIKGPSSDPDVSGDTYVRKSLDHGASWENVGDTPVIFSAGLGYDQANNTLYSPSSDGTGPTLGIYANYIFRLVGGTGEWEDISQSMFSTLGAVYTAVFGTVTQ